MERIDAIVEKARKRARFRIAALRLEYPGQDEVALGRRLIGSMALFLIVRAARTSGRRSSTGD